MMDYRRLPKLFFERWLEQVKKEIESCGIEVKNVSTMPGVSTTGFDGLSITLYAKLDPAVALFNLLHTFGHVIQWCSDEELAKLGREKVVPGSVSDAYIEKTRAYEYQASQYALTLLHELNIHELDQWVSDVWHYDWVYIERIYRGQQGLDPIITFTGRDITYGCPLLAPLPIPQFTPRRFPARSVI